MKTDAVVSNANALDKGVSSPGMQTQSIQPHQETPFPTSSILVQVSSALAGVLLLILLAAWLFRRLGLAPRFHNSKLLTLRSSCQIGQRERVLIVEVENKWLVLGVTAQQITLLETLPVPPQNDISQESSPPMDFRQMMKSVLKRSGRSA